MPNPKILTAKSKNVRYDHVLNRMLQLASKRKILVFMADLPAPVRGFISREPNIEYIVLSDRLDRNDLNQTFAHELGHAMLHTDRFAMQRECKAIEKQELEADRYSERLIKLLEGRDKK